MEVTEVLLPGVGVRYELTAASGEIGIVARREGESDVARLRRSDPDAADRSSPSTGSRPRPLTEILGAPRIVERFAHLSREVPGLDP